MASGLPYEDEDSPEELAMRARQREQLALDRARRADELAQLDLAHGNEEHARMHERESRHHREAADEQRRAAEFQESRAGEDDDAE